MTAPSLTGAPVTARIVDMGRKIIKKQLKEVLVQRKVVQAPKSKPVTKRKAKKQAVDLPKDPQAEADALEAGLKYYKRTSGPSSKTADLISQVPGQCRPGVVFSMQVCCPCSGPRSSSKGAGAHTPHLNATPPYCCRS